MLASAAGGVQVLLGCSFTAQLGSVSMQPQRARQPRFDAWSRLEAPDAANDGVQLLLRPALRAKAVPELGLSRATRYMSAVPLAAQAFCACPVIVTDRLRAPPQACRKIRKRYDSYIKQIMHIIKTTNRLGIWRVVAVKLFRSAVLARQRPCEEVMEVQRRARRRAVELPDGVVRQA